MYASVTHSSSHEGVQTMDDVFVGILAELDSETFLHCQRTQQISLLLGQEIGLRNEDLECLSLGALFHDVGKIYVPSNVLNKRTPLSDEEWTFIRSHPRLGYDCLKHTNLDETVKNIVLNHHLWANGRGGYPHHQSIQEPCLLTQVVTIADVVDAMTSKRPYRSALSMDNCFDHLEENCGTLFNSDLVRVLIESCCEKVSAITFQS